MYACVLHVRSVRLLHIEIVFLHHFCNTWPFVVDIWGNSGTVADLSAYILLAIAVPGLHKLVSSEHVQSLLIFFSFPRCVFFWKTAHYCVSF